MALLRIPTRLQTAVLLLSQHGKGTFQGDIVKQLHCDSMQAMGLLKRLGPKHKLRDGRFSHSALYYMSRHKAARKGRERNKYWYRLTPLGYEALQRGLREHLPPGRVMALSNYCRIAGVQGDCRILALLTPPEAIDSWLPITKGSDVAIAGWGGFDVGAVLYALAAPPYGEGATEYNMQGGDWEKRRIPSVNQVQSQAYFGIATLTPSRLSPTWQAWFAQWRGWWRHNGAIADEVFAVALGLHEAPLLVSPPALPPWLLLAQLEREREQRAVEASKAAKQALKRQTYPLAAASVPLQLGKQTGTLSVVTSHSELAKVGNQLHNCALSRHNQLVQGDYLIAVAADEAGRIVAMGEYERGKGWGQLVGPCNAPTQHAKAIRAVGKQLARMAFAGEQTADTLEGAAVAH